MAQVKTVSILGSTGSVGRSTVDLILSDPGRFAVQALTCRSNTSLLAEQAIKLKARLAVTADPAAYGELKNRLAGTGIEVAAGPQAVIEAAALPADWIMAAIVGMAGLEPVLAAIAQGTCVAIANKEPLVAAGPFVMAAARKAGTTLLPVDSEHNAVFQVFDSKRPEGIEKIILTASGGPFLKYDEAALAHVTPAQALAHPNWVMGAKISVDSATMMNKALEIIEAHYLFGLPAGKIEVLIHPQSLVHALVVYRDGSVLAQMGAPDMRTPIAQTLAWPGRMETTGPRLDFTKNMNLIFYPVDIKQFKSVPMAYECLAEGLWAGIAFNAANEIAVQAFLQNELPFTGIVPAVREAVEQMAKAGSREKLQNTRDVINFDGLVRERTSYNISRDKIRTTGTHS